MESSKSSEKIWIKKWGKILKNQNVSSGLMKEIISKWDKKWEPSNSE